MVHHLDLKRMRAFSSSLFGAQYRLEICGELRSGTVITAIELAERLEHAPSKSCIKMELDRLVAAGLIIRKSREPGSRVNLLEIADSPLWDAARDMLDDLLEREKVANDK